MVLALIRNRGKGLSESGFKDRLIAKKRQNNGGRIAKPFFGETFLFCPLAESNKDGEEGIRKVSWSSGSLHERIPQEALSYFLGKLIPVIKRKPDTLSSPCPRIFPRQDSIMPGGNCICAGRSLLPFGGG